MIYSALSYTWSGPVLMGLILLLCLGVLAIGRRQSNRWITAPSWILTALVVVGLLATCYGSFRISQIESSEQPWGRLVDVGGYRMHILAEGPEGTGAPTIVWVAGQHSAGLAMYHLHQGVKDDFRSILFDRPGSGWSEAGPFPRRTALEAEELARLLERAGEQGPFVVVGHSFGGLLAANYARRYPQRVAALVLLDATPPDTFLYSGFDGLSVVALMGRVQALMRMVGVQMDILELAATIRPDAAAQYAPVRDALGDVLEVMNRSEAGPRAGWASASIFEEGTHPEVLSNAFDLVVYDGELGDMPLYVVLPGELQSLDWSDSDAVAQFQSVSGLASEDLTRFAHISNRVRYRYLQASSNSGLIRAPAGTGHLFPYQEPRFVIDLVKRIARSKR